MRVLALVGAALASTIPAANAEPSMAVRCAYAYAHHLDDPASSGPYSGEFSFDILYTAEDQGRPSIRRAGCEDIALERLDQRELMFECQRRAEDGGDVAIHLALTLQTGWFEEVQVADAGRTSILYQGRCTMETIGF